VSPQLVALRAASHWLAEAPTVPQYQLHVYALTGADVVGSIGGWLFDQVMAGWDARAFLCRECDDRPLRILGAELAGLTTGLVAPTCDQWLW
jgi:hypothetical protein